MHTTQTMRDSATLDTAFRKAKIEHYLMKADEHVQMGRFFSAREILKSVYEMDAVNRAAQSITKRIDFYLSDLMERSSGGESNGSGQKHRRPEIVLVVDQDERVLISLVENLRKYGFGAIGAAGYTEALEVISSFKPHLVISEVNFENGPVGFDLYLWIRNNAGLKDIPFLYLATRITREMLIAGKRLGVDEFMTKPVDEEVVIASTLNALARHKNMHK